LATKFLIRKKIGRWLGFEWRSTINQKPSSTMQSEEHLNSRVLEAKYEARKATPIGQRLQTFITRLPSAWHPYIIGGYLRDTLLGTTELAGDADLVVFGCDSVDDLFSSLRRTYGRSTVVRNRFGGAKLRPFGDTLIFDVWRAQDHLLPSQTPHPRTIQELLKYCLTNIDAVALDPRTSKVFDHGCIVGLRQRRVELICDMSNERAARIAQIIHMILLIEKYRNVFSFDGAVLNAVGNAGQTFGDYQLLAELEEKLRERRYPDIGGARSRASALLEARPVHAVEQ